MLAVWSGGPLDLLGWRLLNEMRLVLKRLLVESVGVVRGEGVVDSAKLVDGALDHELVVGVEARLVAAGVR